VDNKNVFAENLKYYMKAREKSRRDICEALGLSYYTFSDWVNGKKYPRMDKVEMLAAYFGILKSDLIEKRTEEHREMQKKNDTLTDIVVRLRSDAVFSEAVESLYKMDSDKLSSLLAFLK